MKTIHSVLINFNRLLSSGQVLTTDYEVTFAVLLECRELYNDDMSIPDVYEIVRNMPLVQDALVVYSLAHIDLYD